MNGYLKKIQVVLIGPILSICNIYVLSEKKMIIQMYDFLNRFY